MVLVQANAGLRWGRSSGVLHKAESTCRRARSSGLRPGKAAIADGVGAIGVNEGGPGFLPPIPRGAFVPHLKHSVFDA